NPRRTIRALYEYLPLLNRKYDVVHFNAPQIAIRRLEMGAMFKAKTIVSFRGQDFSFHPQRYDRLLRDIDHLHFISNHLLNEAIQRGYARTKHTLISPMVNTDFYRPCSEASASPSIGRFRVFTAARLT